MKKLSLIILIAFSASQVLFAQVTTTNVKNAEVVNIGNGGTTIETSKNKNNVGASNTTKPKFKQYYKVPPDVFNTLKSMLDEYKGAQMYIPYSSPDEKVIIYIKIEKYLNNISSKVQLDSSEMVIKPPTEKQQK